jgi:quercetin dioxygenase-like cupin family protein
MRAFMLILISAAVVASAAQLAGATPSSGIISAPLLARATFGADLMLQVKPSEATGLQWRGRNWQPRQLPEFLAMLRDQAKVSDLGAWLVDHPAVASKLGLPAARKIAGPDFAVQQVTVAPGGTTGWHTHPGPALVLVKSGEFTLYDGDDKSCHGTVYKAGQSFVDAGFGHVHVGRNEGTTNVEFYVVYLAPAPTGQPLRVDAPSPGNCSF